MSIVWVSLLSLDSIDNQEKSEDSTVNGAIFFAVCRGKVSEGISFDDYACRAAFVIGIPYSNRKYSCQILEKWARSIEVTLKYDYENNRKIKGIPGALGGDAWYEMNAFRALNQSLGRCIRHKFDWGSILLLDSRYPSKIPLLTKYWLI